MTSPALVPKHQLDPGALPLQHLPSEMKHQCFNLSEKANDDVVGDLEIASRIFRYRVFIENAIKLR